jgi:hypothetical protein
MVMTKKVQPSLDGLRVRVQHRPGGGPGSVSPATSAAAASATAQPLSALIGQPGRYRTLVALTQQGAIGQTSYGEPTREAH